MTKIFLDIETVAPPKFVEAFRQKCAERDEDPVKFVATSPWMARVISVAMIFEEDGELVEHCSVNRTNDDYGEMLVLRHVADVIRDNDQLVTFAGRIFDIPILHHKNTKIGIHCPAVKSAFSEYRFKPYRNLDLQDLMTGFGATARRPSLREVCLGYGLDDPKQNGDGSCVQNLVEQGRWDDLKKYNIGDVRPLVKLWEIWSGESIVAKIEQEQESLF